MKRDPSIHVTQSELARLLKEAGVTNAEVLSDVIFKLPRKSLSHRMLVSLDKKGTQRVKKVLSSKSSDIELFARLLITPFSKPIKEGTAQYTNLVKTIELATEFTELFNLEKIDGYQEYHLLGKTVMGKRYALNKFSYYHEKITNLYQHKKEIEADSNKQGTKEIFSWYVKFMKEGVGVDFTIKPNDYTSYINFVYTRQEADQNKANYKDWIKAQFDGFTFLNIVPEINQVWGDGALKRYRQSLTLLKKEVDNYKGNKYLDKI